MKNPNVIDQFMWGYQPHYYISLKLFAERFFNSILPNIFNQVFLVGTLIPGETDRNKVCIQQEDDEYSQNDFLNYEELYEQLLQVSPGNHVFQSHPIAQEHHRQNVEKSALRDSIKKCVEQKAVFHDVITFVSTYSPIEKFNVSIVLQLNKKEYDSFYKLFKESDNRFSISKSIIDSAVPLFFTEALKALRDKESDGADLCSVDEEYLRKKAAINYFYSISCKGQNGLGIHGLYDSINNISSLKYESNDAIGSIIIARKDHPNIRMEIEFSNTYSIRKPRLIRKLLELTNKDLCLICDSYEVYGIGKVIGEYNPINEDLFKISIIGHYQWNLLHDNKILLQSKYGMPYLPKGVFSQDEFKCRTKRIFTDIQERQLFELYHCIISLIEEHKGGILIISDHAEEESKRLAKQSITITPIILSPDNIKKLSSIDGAILINTDCKCFSIGTILDGVANDNGNPERGSRFNSSLRYCDYRRAQGERVVVVVISEDGMVDILPKLNPILKRQDIENIVSKYINIVLDENIDIGDFNKQTENLYKFKFYFSKEQCDLINNKRKEIESYLWKNVEVYIQIVHDDLSPDPKFDDTYLE